MAQGEVRQLISMVQQTLDATKSFIFDVRPMVLDDLGLVPTLRRAARERGQRAGIAVEFDSMGTDRRLPMEIESGLFRIFDEALTGYLAATPDRVALNLDWAADRLEGRVSASRDRSGAIEQAERLQAEVEAQLRGEDRDKGRGRGKDKEKELPPALVAMIDDRRVAAEAATEAARSSAIVALPAAAWREIQQRAGGPRRRGRPGRRRRRAPDLGRPGPAEPGRRGRRLTRLARCGGGSRRRRLARVLAARASSNTA